jgi:HAD superfamily hydrolase (TIGR01490 family)
MVWWSARSERTAKLLPLNSDLPTGPPPGIAAFDLDGTLLAWDCQLLFRHHVIRRQPWRVLTLPLFLACLPFIRWLGDSGMKRVFLSYLWRMPPDKLAEHARSFAAAVRPAIYPELLERLAAHRHQGHLLILTSASPEFYVAEIGRELGFDLALGTPVATTPRCPLFPQLRNHKGAAKVTRLSSLLPESYFNSEMLVNSHGYTDSRADLPLLALCQNATVVNPSPALAALAESSGWQIVRPQRPWRTQVGFGFRVLALLLGLARDPGGLGAATKR